MFLLQKSVAIAALAVVTLFAQPGQADVRWDLTTAWPDSNFHTVNAKLFADEVSKATDGEVVIEVKAGGQLGFKGPELLSAVRDGLVPMADILSVLQVGIEPVLGAEGIPFLAGSADELRVLHKHLRPLYDEVAMRNNQKILYMVPWPTQYLHMKLKVSSLDELADIKVRGPDKSAVDMLNAVGMTGVLIPWAELIPALASGAVDGVSTSGVSGVDGKFWEFLDYLYPTNHIWSSQIVTVNLDAWAELTPEQQAIVEGLGDQMQSAFWENSLVADQDSRKTLVDNGLEIVEMPEQMMVEFRERTEPLFDAFIERAPEAEAPLRAYLNEVGR
ncbi:MAG: TRAP transporter substrate-binding protein [Pseudomonadota bacterium]